jgi:predicted dehydrogenase
MQKCQITHICAKTDTTLSAFPNKYKKTTRYQDLIKENNLDGIIIATPAHTHLPIARDFIREGINVLIEKPVIVSLSQIEELKRITAKSSSVVMAGHIFTYNPAFQKLVQLRQKIGKVLYIESEGCDFGPVRSDVSMLWDWLPHDLSMCMKIFSEAAAKISAWAVNTNIGKKTKQPDMVHVRIEFSNHVPVFIKIGWLSPVKKRSFMLTGTKGMLRFDDTQEHKLQLMTYPELKTGEKIVPSAEDILIRFPAYSTHQPLQCQVAEFTRRIKEKHSINDVSEIIAVARVTRVIEAAL